MAVNTSMLTEQEVRYGYWGARRLAGELPETYYSEPTDYKGEEALCFYRAPALTLSPVQERRRIARWCEALPHMKLKTLIFECRVSQSLFDSATQITGLEALCVQHSSCTSIAKLVDCSRLKALEFGSSSPVADLRPLAALPNLTNLRVFHLRERNLDFVCELKFLQEFGFLWNSIDRVPTIDSLGPLADLSRLQLLWLDVKISRGGLFPLHKLTNLVNLHVSFDYSVSDFSAIRAALPSLKYGSPFDEHRIREFCKG
jgi:hypothetical protein